MLINLLLILASYLRMNVKLDVWLYWPVLWRRELTDYTYQHGSFIMKPFECPFPFPAPCLLFFPPLISACWTSTLNHVGHRIHLHDVMGDTKEIDSDENVWLSSCAAKSQGESLRRIWRFPGSRWERLSQCVWGRQKELMWPYQSGQEYSGKLSKIGGKMTDFVFLKSWRGMTAK